MVYAVDIVHKFMRELSSSEPVLFQRNGSLYMASNEGFAQVTHGNLPTAPIGRWGRDYSTGKREDKWVLDKNQPDSIVESEDLIEKWEKNDYRGSKPFFVEGEEKQVSIFSFGPDDDSFTLENMVWISEESRKLPDDGKIRMLSHSHTYHSHKYGYAADGIDVNLRSGRVMDKEKYLHFVRKREEDILEKIARSVTMEPRPNGVGYKQIPDCLVVTPHMMFGFPRRGVLDVHSTNPDSWSKKTEFSTSREGRILDYSEPNPRNESPFEIFVKLNAKDFCINDLGIGRDNASDFNERTEGELIVLDNCMPKVLEFLKNMNEIHNKAYFIPIQCSKDFRKSLAEMNKK